MATMTLLEYKKTVTDPTTLFVINEFLNSRLLQVLPFMDVQGGGYFYSKTDKLPGVGFRGINSNFTSDISVLNPQAEALKIFGSDIKIDVALVDRHGAGRREVEVRNTLESLRLGFEKAFFKGDSSIAPAEFDGLQRRIGGTQKIDNGADGSGNVLSIGSLKKAVDQVKGGTGRKFLFCNDQVGRIIEDYYESTANGMMRYTTNELGEEVMMFRGCEVVKIQDDAQGNEILPFTEASTDASTTNNSSIYVARFGDNLTTGIQGPSNGVSGMYAEDFGRMESEAKYLTRVHWDCGMVIANGRSVARLAGIQDGTAVA